MLACVDVLGLNGYVLPLQLFVQECRLLCFLKKIKINGG